MLYVLINTLELQPLTQPVSQCVVRVGDHLCESDLKYFHTLLKTILSFFKIQSPRIDLRMSFISTLGMRMGPNGRSLWSI